MFEKAPAIHISIEQSINLGNYQTAKVSMSITNLPFEADEDMIETAMATQAIAFTKMKEAMRGKIAKIRREGGFEGEVEEIVERFPRRG